MGLPISWAGQLVLQEGGGSVVLALPDFTAEGPPRGWGLGVGGDLLRCSLQIGLEEDEIGHIN